MRLTLTLLAWMAFSVAAFCLAQGCQPAAEQYATDPGAPQGDVNLYRDVQFDDIPVPPEYWLLPRETHSFQGASFRSGFFVYDGQLEWTVALDFYREQLPGFGWEQESVERGFDFRILRCRKGPESLIVTIRQIRNGSRVEIQLDNVERNDLLLKGKLGPPRQR